MFRKAYTFDDVLLSPKYSNLKTRSSVILKTKLVEGINLNIPIVASNMDTVCESDMAIKMAELGGLGIVHRYLSVEDQTEEVARVKNHFNFIISEPYTINETTSLSYAVDFMVEQNVSSLLVTNDAGLFVGILGLKDSSYRGNFDTDQVSKVMIPAENVITATSRTTKKRALELMQNQRVGKLPVLRKDGSIVGLITHKTLNREDLYPLATKDDDGRLVVGAAVGVNGDFITRSKKLIQAGVDVLVLDIAHGHSAMCIEALNTLKAQFTIPIIAGNVATAQGALDLVAAGDDGIKVGVGPGSICTTRIVTGHGVPQLTAILDVCNAVGVPVIADGGIRRSGDIVKALAAGASTVMLGSLLAGTDESPGGVITRDGSRYKMIRGMASFGAALGRSKRAGDEVSEATPEGVEALIPYRGSVEEIISNLAGGVRSGFSYSGATTLEELWQNAEFVEISPAGLIESRHHDVKAL